MRIAVKHVGRLTPYSPTQLIDLLSAIAMKTLTNYLDPLTRIELDDSYKAEAK